MKEKITITKAYELNERLDYLLNMIVEARSFFLKEMNFTEEHCPPLTLENIFKIPINKDRLEYETIGRGKQPFDLDKLKQIISRYLQRSYRYQSAMCVLYGGSYAINTRDVEYCDEQAGEILDEIESILITEKPFNKGKFSKHLYNFVDSVEKLSDIEKETIGNRFLEISKGSAVPREDWISIEILAKKLGKKKIYYFRLIRHYLLTEICKINPKYQYFNGRYWCDTNFSLNTSDYDHLSINSETVKLLLDKKGRLNLYIDPDTVAKILEI
jgi:predicted DNA-binding protein